MPIKTIPCQHCVETVRTDYICINQGKLVTMNRQHYWKEEDFYNVAVLGQGRTGKSMLINAYFNFPAHSAEETPTGALGEPQPHTLPGSAVALWDTPSFDDISELENYCNKIHFYNYDFYIVVCSSTVGKFEQSICEKILDQNKMYFCVCTKIDQILDMERQSCPDSYSEEFIRKGICQRIEETLPCSRVFLVNCCQPTERQMEELRELTPLAAKQSKEYYMAIHKACTTVLQVDTKTLPRKSQSQENKQLQDHDDLYNVAVVGKSGAGKSTFINAYFGFQHNSLEAAASDIIERTTKSCPYHLPGSCVVLWDTPGFGTPTMPDDEQYYDKIDFNNYGFYILISCDKVNEFEQDLCRRICCQNKGYFYVRTKMDQALRNEQRGHPQTFSAEATKSEILDKIGRDLPQSRVFLVDSHKPEDFDFPNLRKLVSYAAQLSQSECAKTEMTSRRAVPTDPKPSSCSIL